MVAKNDITGDSIQSRPSSAYESNFDSIFRKPKLPEGTTVDNSNPWCTKVDLGDIEVTTNQPLVSTEERLIQYSLADIQYKGWVRGIFATGSRHICNPPVTTTDEDYIVYMVGDSIEYLVYLSSVGWIPSCEEQYGGDFFSMENGDINLIITDDYEFFIRSYHAHVLAKRLNLTNKQDRVDIFELARYGRIKDIQNPI